MTEENNPINTVEPTETQNIDVSNQPIDNISANLSDEQQINWKKFREAREQERKQREEAERRAAQKDAEAAALKAAMDALLTKPSPQYEFQDEEDEDSRIQKKVEEALRKRAEKESEERSIREKQELPKRLKENFSDFERVCTPENLDYLEFNYPELATAFNHMPDGVEKWGSVYKAIKRFIPNLDQKSDRAKIEKNLSRPQAMASAGVTQVGDTAPIKLDEKRRAENWARMQKVMKGI